VKEPAIRRSSARIEKSSCAGRSTLRRTSESQGMARSTSRDEGCSLWDHWEQCGKLRSFQVSMGSSDSLPGKKSRVAAISIRDSYAGACSILAAHARPDDRQPMRPQGSRCDAPIRNRDQVGRCTQDFARRLRRPQIRANILRDSNGDRARARIGGHRMRACRSARHRLPRNQYGGFIRVGILPRGQISFRA